MQAELARARSGLADLEAEYAALADPENVALDDEHDSEGPTVGFERARVAGLVNRSRRHIADLEAAARRTADGSYRVLHLVREGDRNRAASCATGHVALHRLRPLRRSTRPPEDDGCRARRRTRLPRSARTITTATTITHRDRCTHPPKVVIQPLTAIGGPGRSDRLRHHYRRCLRIQMSSTACELLPPGVLLPTKSPCLRQPKDRTEGTARLEVDQRGTGTRSVRPSTHQKSVKVRRGELA